MNGKYVGWLGMGGLVGIHDYIPHAIKYDGNYNDVIKGIKSRRVRDHSEHLRRNGDVVAASAVCAWPNGSVVNACVHV